MSWGKAESWDAEQIEAWEHDRLLLMQELGDNYYKLHRRDHQDSEEDPFEEEERVRWQEEAEEAKTKYFKMIAEEEERGYYRQTVAEVDKPKKDHSPESGGGNGIQKAKGGASDPTDSFHPQGDNSTGVQESNSQHLTTKALGELGEVEAKQADRSSKELDEKAEGDSTKQVIENHFEEKKVGERDEEDKSGKKQMPRAYKLLSWRKKRCPASTGFQ